MKYLIITPYIEGDLADVIDGETFDRVICADDSLDLAKGALITPDVVIGDFDHGKKPDIENIIQVPCEKDDTDTMLCIKYAIENGADRIVVAGGIGGRLDHTVANIQSLAYACDRGVKISLRDGSNEAFIIDGYAEIPRREGYYFSVFAYGGKCERVFIGGTKYTLSGAPLETTFPLGVSNEIIEDRAIVRVSSGKLLAVFSKK